MTKRMTLAESTSHLSMWIVGLCSAIYFFQKFESELKPLVLAFIFVSILEGVVQFFEWFFNKSLILVCKLIWKSWLSLGWCIIKVCGCGEDGRRLRELKKSILYDWGDLFTRWKGSDAGRSSIFRILAVVLTLNLVGILAFVIKGLVQNEVSTALSKFGLYKSQVSTIAGFLGDLVSTKLPELPNLVPPRYRQDAQTAVLEAQTDINKVVNALPAMVEGWAVWLLNEIVSTTSSSVMSIVFFMLYSAFLLFDPLHISFQSPLEVVQDISASDRTSALAHGWSKHAARHVKRELHGQVRGLATRVWRQFFSQNPGSRSEPLLEPHSESLEEGVEIAAESDTEESEGAHAEDRFKAKSEKEQFRLTEVQHLVYRIVWNYFLITMLLNAAFGTLVYFLLQSLNLDMAVIIGAVTFLLSFIPELGAIIASALPLPFLLLTPTQECSVPADQQVTGHTYYNSIDVNCISDFGSRSWNLVLCISGFFLIKLLVGNILAAYLMGRNRVLTGAIGNSTDGEVRETHAVLVLFAVVFFGKVWGVVGMLISVPIISVVRLTINLGSVSAEDAHNVAASMTGRATARLLRGMSRGATQTM